MLTCNAEQILEAAIVHAPGFSIKAQMIRAASAIANSIAIELIMVRRSSIERLERKVDAYIDAVIDCRAVRAPASMEIDHLNPLLSKTAFTKS
jgi:hypothetical protein